MELKDLANPSPGQNRDLRAHWDSTYERRGHSEVSWFQAEPAVSLALIAETGIPPEAAVIDVGGGASALVDRLIGQGFADISVLDISAVAIEEPRRRLPADAPVAWLVSDVLSWRPARRFDLWHDRAVFHFLISPADKDAYRHTLASALAPGGLVVIGTFAADGPESCSSLPVARYSEPELASALGDRFAPIAFRREVHRTPAGGTQPFTWLVARLIGEPSGHGPGPGTLAEMDSPATIDQLLERARTNIDRLTPVEALTAQRAGALIVDIRPLEERRRDGSIAGALVVDRNVLEWRLAPTSRWRLDEVSDRKVILVCNQGYQSSLAAYTLRQLSLPSTADVIGGFEAWLAAGLPIIDPPNSD